MNFKNVQEAFNYYRKHNKAALETRAQEVREVIERDDSADVSSYNIEIDGIMKVLEDIEDVEDNGQRGLNPIKNEGFNVTSAETRSVYDTNEYRSAFFKQMIGKELNENEKRAFNQATDMQKTENRAALTSSDAGAVLPTETLNEVVRKAREKGGLMQEVRAFNMPTGIKIPIGTPTDAAEWHTEGEEVEAETPNVASVKFNGYEIVKVFSLSVKVQGMSISAFEAYLTDELAAAVMETLARSLVNGTGEEQGTGLDTIAWGVDNKVDGTGEYEDITNALAKLKRGYGANAKFAMNNTTLYSKVFNMVDNNGRPLFVQDLNAGGVGRLLGKPVIIDDYIEDNEIILGDFNYMAYNLPVGIDVESSRESSFRSALIDYRAVAVADTKPLVEEAFIKIDLDAGEDAGE